MPLNQLTEVWVGFQVSGCGSESDHELTFEDLPKKLQEAWNLNELLKSKGIKKRDKLTLENSICNLLKDSICVNLEPCDLFDLDYAQSPRPTPLDFGLPTFNITRFSITGFSYCESLLLPYVDVCGLISIPWKRISDETVQIGEAIVHTSENWDDWADSVELSAHNIISISFETDVSSSKAFDHHSFLDTNIEAESWMMTKEEAIKEINSSGYSLRDWDFVK